MRLVCLSGIICGAPLRPGVMKLACTILMSGLLLCSCSGDSAIDLVQAGKDTEWPSGYVVA